MCKQSTTPTRTCSPTSLLLQRQRPHAHTRAQCVQKCCEKYMKHSSRVGVRFAELSSQVQTDTGRGEEGW